MRTALVSTTTLDEPVTFAEMMQHLAGKSETVEESLLMFFIQTAKEQVEHLGVKLMAQTWDIFLDAFPCDEIVIPYGPLVSVSHVKYYDSDNVLQTVDAADYVVDTSGMLGRVYLAHNKYWPTPIWSKNAVTVRAVVGYPNIGSIPQSIKSYIKLYAEALLFRTPLDPRLDRMLDPYRVDFVV